MSKTLASTIIRFVISEPVTLIREKRFAVRGAALCLKVLDFLHTGAQQIAASEAASSSSLQKSVALNSKSKCNLQAVLPCQEKRELHLEDEPQPGTSANANQRQFLGELLRDCGFFAHLVFRQVRAVDSPSHRLKVSQTLPRSASRVLPRRLLVEAPAPQAEAPSSLLHTLWVEIGCRRVQILVSEKGAS